MDVFCSSCILISRMLLRMVGYSVIDNLFNLLRLCNDNSAFAFSCLRNFSVKVDCAQTEFALTHTKTSRGMSLIGILLKGCLKESYSLLSKLFIHCKARYFMLMPYYTKNEVSILV